MPVKIFARVRPMLPFEKGQANIIHSEGNNLILIPPKGDKSFERREFLFTGIAGQDSNNEGCFKTVAQPMCNAVLEGYNGILMAYGQTGCGKTYTMLGKPQRNVVGLIPRCVQFLLNNEATDKVEMSVVEAYSRNVMKIELYDLLQDVNDNEDWTKKKGSTTLQVPKLKKVHLKEYSTAHDLVVKGQHNSHVAATGKNPESSRGHTMYLFKVTQKCQGNEMIDPATFVFVDLAGSEGDTALTPEFCASHTEEEVLMRRMEGGVINNGLSAVQAIFRELGKNGKVAQVGKVGIRRILLPFVNQNTYISVMFMMSPAYFNSGPTISTLYFAKAAQLVKIKPKKKQKRVNWEKLAAEQQKELDELQDECDALKKQCDEAAGGVYVPPPTPAAPSISTDQSGTLADSATLADASVETAATVVMTPSNTKSIAPHPDLVIDDKVRDHDVIMKVENLKDLNFHELIIRIEGTEAEIEQERQSRIENEKNKDLFIEYLTQGMNSLRKKMRKLAKAHMALKKAKKSAK